MKISIIIPSYNQQLYLPDAIESALSQTVKCEIIVIDDGSTDNSLEIARRYEKQNKNLKVVSQVNKGLPSARNTGIMHAKGDYVLPLDADDILEDNCVERILEVIKETGSEIVSPSFKEFGISNSNIILMPNPELADFVYGNRVAYCSAIKKSLLLKVGGYSPRMFWGYEDLHLTINLLMVGAKIVTIPEVLWLYRTKEESMITTSKMHHEELINQINKDFPEAQLTF